jgi:hypothetical protein
LSFRRTFLFAIFVAFLCSSSLHAQSSDSAIEALIGEYTNPVEPDTPLSFYVQGGKLMEESERMVPTELKPISSTEFRRPSAIGDKDITLHFILDAAGHGATVTETDEPDTVYHRTGDAIHHVFHDYQRGSHDSHARWSEAARGGPEARGHCRAAAVPDAAHSLRR